MIATADFCRPTADQLFSAAVHDAYSDDALVPGADPYIAQLVAEHQAELHVRSRRTVGGDSVGDRSRTMTLRHRTTQLAVA